VRLSYVVSAPVWKATYRILLGEPGASATGVQPTIQGWAVVDNTQEEDWEQVELTLVAGLPVSFVHDLYTPRYVRRPVVEVQETTGVLPPKVEAGIGHHIGGSAAPQAIAKFGLEDDTAPSAPSVRVASTAPVDRPSIPSSVQIQVREREVGDLFEYRVERPVTIRRDQSGLVPIVLKPFDGRTVLLYQREAWEKNPLRCVEFKNTTGLTLEGGPVTVVESGSYVGEAMLETMKPKEERLVAYAVELAVRVLVDQDGRHEPSHQFSVRNGTLTSTYYHVSETSYSFTSRSPRDEIVFLDHQRRSSKAEPFDMPAPYEVTELYWRFRFVLPANSTTRYVVKGRELRSQSVAITDSRSKFLFYWLERRPKLDPAIRQPLQQIVDLNQQVAGFEEQIQRLEKERDALFQEQQRIRENLNALGDKATERTLRDRLVNKLNAQEDRLEQIAQELQRLTEERDRARGRIADALAGLEFEGAL
jgi:hypothetical protein